MRGPESQGPEVLIGRSVGLMLVFQPGAVMADIERTRWSRARTRTLAASCFVMSSSLRLLTVPRLHWTSYRTSCPESHTKPL